MSGVNIVLAEILARWASDRHVFEDFEAQATGILKSKLSQHGIQARISSRVKTDNSLAKKLIKKGATIETYETLSDRVGLRVVTRFRSEIDIVSKIVKDSFVVQKFEDKASLLEIKENGYKSLHFDCSIPKASGQLAGVVGEIQVRTMCEDVWSELTHDISYKPVADLPRKLARQIYSIAGLLEIADDTIEGIARESRESIKLEPMTTVNFLESKYLTVFPAYYDKELSIATLERLLEPLTMWNFDQFKQSLSEYFESNREKLVHVLDERSTSIALYPFVSQPEFILICYLMDNRPHDLVASWPNLYTFDDLCTVSVWWGKPLQDYI